MNNGDIKAAWAWKRGRVDKSRHHISISYGDLNKIHPSECLNVALVSKPENKCFSVEFLIPETDPAMREPVGATIKELDFYLVDKGESDPWEYALYHCTTAANLYSSVHWNPSAGVIPDWNHNEIQICRSRGGVIATTHPFENLVRPKRVDWPPPEIVQKLYKSRQERSFMGLNLQAARYGLGYYCDLQSLHSEDAITWSVFGTLRYSPKEQRESWVRSFFEVLGLHEAVQDYSEISLWRRTPHPDNLSPGGPEIDVWISTKNAIVLAEVKWLSGIGTAQGKEKDKDQLQIRQKLLKEYGHRFFPEKEIQTLVSISLSANTFSEDTNDEVAFRSVTWDQIINLDSHPDADEVKRYFIWKKGNRFPPSLPFYRVRGRGG